MLVPGSLKFQGISEILAAAPRRAHLEISNVQRFQKERLREGGVVIIFELRVKQKNRLSCWLLWVALERGGLTQA